MSGAQHARIDEYFMEKSGKGEYLIDGEDVQSFQMPDGYDEDGPTPLEGLEVVEAALERFSHAWNLEEDGGTARYEHRLPHEGHRHEIELDRDSEDVRLRLEYGEEGDTEPVDIDEHSMRDIEARLRGDIDPETGIPTSRAIHTIVEEELGEERHYHTFRAGQAI
ncbi:MAG: hypothetical protein ABEJ91_02830 [Candidatus Nanohaloarchaea archaeon]